MCNFRKPRTVERYLGSYIDGHWVDSLDDTFTIQGSLQPLKGNELMLLPENRREIASYKVYTDTELFTATKGSNQSPDRIILSDGAYEVVRVEPWQNDIINHYKVFISKLVSND